MIDIDEFKKKLDEDLADPNGYWNTLKRKDEIRATQVERLKVRIESDPNGVMEKLLAKYQSDEYRDREYFKCGCEPREPLLWLVYEYASKYCTECDDEEYLNDFTGGAYYVGDYVIQVMHGQGSCVVAEKLKGPRKPSKKQRMIDVIESRILAEHRKHANSMPTEWAKIAAHKIFAELKGFYEAD